MNFFWLLILAHLIADFPLQTDRIFEYKTKYSWGIIYHASIYALATLIIAFPYIKYPSFWLLLSLLSLIHIGLDRAKIEVTRRGVKDNLLLFLADQGLHFFSIWLLACRFFNFPPIVPEANQLRIFYEDYRFALRLSGFIFAIFGGTPLIYYLKKTLRLSEVDAEFPNIRMRFPEYLERLISTSGAYMGGWFLFVVPLAFLPRFFLNSRKDYTNLVTGLILCLSMGVCIKNL